MITITEEQVLIDLIGIDKVQAIVEKHCKVAVNVYLKDNTQVVTTGFELYELEDGRKLFIQFTVYIKQIGSFLTTPFKYNNSLVFDPQKDNVDEVLDIINKYKNVPPGMKNIIEQYK